MFLKTNKTNSSGQSKKETELTIIARGMNVLGNIVSEGIIDCNGIVEGNIRCKMLTIREHGVVKGEITVETVLVYGKVNGLIRAKHVQLFATCSIEGIVMHESLSIEDGAFIDGKCKRTDKPIAVAEPVEIPFGGAFDDEIPEKVEKSKMLENIRLIR